MRACQADNDLSLPLDHLILASVLTSHDIETLQNNGLKVVERQGDLITPFVPRLPRTMNVAGKSESSLLPMIESEESFGRFNKTEPSQSGWALDGDQNLRRIVRRQNPLGTNRVSMIAIESIKERLRNFLHGISSGEDQEINYQLAHMPARMLIEPPVIHSQAISKVLAQAQSFRPGPSYFDSDEAYSLTKMREYVKREKRSMRRVAAQENQQRRHARILAERQASAAAAADDPEDDG